MTLAVLGEFQLPSAPRYLAAAPITHVAGSLVLPTLMLGGTVHLSKGFDPEKLLSTIASERINMTLLVPTMIYVLLDHPKLPKDALSSLELLLYGASPMSPTRLIEGLERIGPVFSQLYGQTECYPVSLLRKTDHDKSRPELFGSCGYPVAGCDVKLLRPDGQETIIGEAGEICVRAPWIMDEYWKRPEQTAEALNGEWLHTGDIARADKRGYLYIVDRKKDMIVTGGFNVYPREVEDVLMAHSGVAQAAVIATPDPKWGEAVTAVVVPKPGSIVDRGRACRAGQGTKRRSSCTETRGVRRGIAGHGCRQGRQEAAARKVLGRAGAHGGLSSRSSSGRFRGRRRENAGP